MEKANRSTAFAVAPALAAAVLLLFGSPNAPSAAESQANPAIQRQVQKKAAPAKSVEVPSSIGGIDIPPGSDLERMLNSYLNEDEPTNTKPLDHGK